MNGGQMPAVVAKHIAVKHNLPMHAVLTSTITQDPFASYWKVEVDGPHGSLICIPVSDQMMLAGGVSAATKYGPKQMSESHMTGRQMTAMAAAAADLHTMMEAKIKAAADATPTVKLTPEVIKAMADSVDKATYKAMKEAQFAKMYGASEPKVLHGINAVLDDYKAQIKAQLAHEPLAFKCLKTEGGGYEFKMHGNPTYAVKPPHHKNVTPAYDPPTKPAKVGQQISLDI